MLLLDWESGDRKDYFKFKWVLGREISIYQAGKKKEKESRRKGREGKEGEGREGEGKEREGRDRKGNGGEEREGREGKKDICGRAESIGNACG